LATLGPGYAIFLPACAAVLLLLALLDLMLSARCMQGLRIEPDPVTRLARGTDGKLTLHLRCSERPPQQLSIGLPMPVAFLQEKAVQTVRLAETKTAHWTLDWQLTARARGIFPCPPVVVEQPSRWRLFALRQSFPNQAEVRVYPNLRRERRQLANLFLNRGNIGTHAQRMVGQGREYEQLREYNHGDSMLDIHWKASAKRGELATKTYQVERTQEIYLVMDHSRLSGLHSTRAGGEVDDDYAETILERYVTAASVLSLVAERQGDHFGLVGFGQRVSRFVRASSGKQHGQVIQDALFDLKTERGPFDLDELFTFLSLRLRRRALLIFLTDLSDSAAAAEFQQRVKMVAARHVVLVNSIRRPGVHPLYDEPKDAPARLITEELAGHMRWEGLRHLQRELRAQGVEFALVDDEKLSVEIVNQYLAIKQRQIL
jgi:uncharacterized protein (DUF58 family)